MSESTAVAVDWHQYLDALDEAIRRTELEIAVHPGSFEPPREFADDELPDGDMPGDCLRKATEIHSRMAALVSVIEGHMNELTNHRASMVRDTPSVFFDSRF